MGKRGPKPKEKVKIKWSPNFAYAIGLLVTDGCLYNDGRHISFVSKDIEQVENYMRCLDIVSKIGISLSGHKKSEAFRVQISDAVFHTFLQTIGVYPNKSKTISEVQIPQGYFFDFLRGCFDGDGSFYSYWDPRFKSSHMFYIEFICASLKHVEWVQKELFRLIGVRGHFSTTKKHSALQLRYAKREALEIIHKMYYTAEVICLSRKRQKIEKALAVERKQQETYS